MSLRPQDVLCALKIFVLRTRGETGWSFSELATSLGLSKGEAHNAVKRGIAAGIVLAVDGKVVTNDRRLHTYLVHGLPIAHYAVRGAVGKGLPTAFSAPLFASRAAMAPEIPMVWKWESGGKVSGETLEPIYPTVPEAASVDNMLYELLVLVDAVRVGGHRERKVAETMLEKIILQADEKVSSPMKEAGSSRL